MRYWPHWWGTPPDNTFPPVPSLSCFLEGSDLDLKTREGPSEGAWSGGSGLGQEGEVSS